MKVNGPPRQKWALGERRREFLAVGEACVAISWPTPAGFNGRTLSVSVLHRGDLSFCIRSGPLRELLNHSGRFNNCGSGVLTHKRRFSVLLNLHSHHPANGKQTCKQNRHFFGTGSSGRVYLYWMPPKESCLLQTHSSASSSMQSARLPTSKLRPACARRDVSFRKHNHIRIYTSTPSWSALRSRTAYYTQVGWRYF